jgi:hypothetical protein
MLARFGNNLRKSTVFAFSVEARAAVLEGKRWE